MRERCIACESGRLELLHDFGRLPVPGYLVDTREAALAEPLFPCRIARCADCGHAQQASEDAETFLVERVYGSYQSTYGMSPGVMAYMERFLDRAFAAAPRLRPGDVVLEIGSNDSRVLELVAARGHPAAGFDPSADVEAGRRKGLLLERAFFGPKTAADFVARHGRCELVFSRHTFEHLFRPAEVFAALASVLSPSGRAVIEVPYLWTQVLHNQFQSMTFQHVSYFSITTLERIVARMGLRLVDALLSPMDAGSVVAVVAHASSTDALRSPRLLDLLDFEAAQGLQSAEGVAFYFRQLAGSLAGLRRFAERLQARGRRLVGFGGGSKGQALLNVAGLDHRLVPWVMDETPGVAGTFVPGTGNALCTPAELREAPPDVVLITAPSHVPALAAKARATFGERVGIVSTVPGPHLADDPW